MRIEIVANEYNLFSIWKVNIHDILTDMSKINAGASVSDFNMPKSEKWAKIMEGID